MKSLLSNTSACLLLLITLASTVSESGTSLQLNKRNFSDLTRDKAVMIRFVTKWCEICEETQSDWDELSKEWESHPIGLVAEVCCDSEDGEEICEIFEVSGYPSVYYGDPDSPEIYNGKLDHESLSKFAKDNLSSLPCSLKNLVACDDATRKLTRDLQGKTMEELERMEERVLNLVDQEQKKFDKFALEMQKKYEEMANAFNAKIDKLRAESGFKWIQQELMERERQNNEDIFKDVVDNEDGSESQKDEL